MALGMLMKDDDGTWGVEVLNHDLHEPLPALRLELNENDAAMLKWIEENYELYAATLVK